MGDAIIRAKIFLDDPSGMEAVKEEIGKIVKLQGSNVEELGFGIKILKIVFVEDESKGTEEVEGKLSSISGVSQVEIESVDRAL